jgi:alkylation response protein AidB-like acyl-CoA dehydrogenase
LLVSAAISAEMISEFGTDEQRKTWLPGLAAGTSKVVFAITELDAGSNTLRISTTAVRDGEDCTPPPRRRSLPWTRPSRCTAGTAWPASTD